MARDKYTKQKIEHINVRGRTFVKIHALDSDTGFSSDRRIHDEPLSPLRDRDKL